MVTNFLPWNSYKYAIIGIYLNFSATDSREAVWLGYFVYYIFAIARAIQEVRFFLLTVLASLMIPEIRGNLFLHFSTTFRNEVYRENSCYS